MLEYNIENEIYVYRFSSASFPWQSEYEFPDLPDFPEIKKYLEQIGEKVKKHNLRVSYHPGPFNVLGSENE